MAWLYLNSIIAYIVQAGQHQHCLENSIQSAAHTHRRQTAHQTALIATPAGSLLLHIVLLLGLLLVVTTLWRALAVSLRRPLVVALLVAAAISLVLLVTLLIALLLVALLLVARLLRRGVTSGRFVTSGSVVGLGGLIPLVLAVPVRRGARGRIVVRHRVKKDGVEGGLSDHGNGCGGRVQVPSTFSCRLRLSS